VVPQRACEEMGTGSERVEQDGGESRFREVPVPISSQAQGDADVAPQYGPGLSSPGASSTGLSQEIRRLPPVDELNPFRNDGYDPPVPDVSGMNYPSTGMPSRSS